jgi:hypothetical protein
LAESQESIAFHSHKKLADTELAQEKTVISIYPLVAFQSGGNQTLSDPFSSR